MRETEPLQKNLDHFSICACHPCAGAMLIFSVSFQFYRMSPEGQSSCLAFLLKNSQPVRNPTDVGQWIPRFIANSAYIFTSKFKINTNTLQLIYVAALKSNLLYMSYFPWPKPVILKIKK